MILDSTSAIDFYVNSFYNMLVSFFGMFDSITFHGISLLDFSLGVLILTFILPIVIALVRPRDIVNAHQRSEYYKARTKYFESRTKKSKSGG